jgi:hypothetical protein
MKYLILLICIAVFGCGYTSKQNELTGQVKKVIAKTPIICPDYTQVDISLGVIRNGVGSMSHEDMIITVTDKAQATLLKQAAESGKLVKITYDVARVTFCVPNELATNVEVLEK